MRLRFKLEAWSAWAAGLQTAADWRAWARAGAPLPEPAEAPAKGMPALLRRRLGRGDRQGVEAAWSLAGDAKLPVAWASRHGQIVRSAGLLEALARGEAPAPMDFSLSVHNAPLGLLAIAREDPSPASAVAAGDESLAAGILEAAGWVLEGAPAALVVHADEAPPAPYAGRWSGDCADFGLALRLGRGGVSMELALEAAAEPDSPGSLPEAFVRALALDASEGVWIRGGRRWSWSRVANP